MKTNPNDPINSRPYSHDERPSGGFEGDRPETFQAFTGLTKREYFAAMAMQGLIASYNSPDWPNAIAFAEHAVRLSDTLIKELNSIPEVTTHDIREIDRAEEERRGK